MATHSIVGFDELNLDEALAEHQLDFDSWAILISHVENKYRDDIDKLSSVYDSFLSEFPLCCGYWRRYAAHKSRLCSVEDVVEVYEKAVETASFSVDIWVDYCSFAISVFEDPFDVSRLFRRGLSFIEKDYLCHPLWDRYIEFEFSQKQWRSLSQIYIEALKFPTKKLHQYYDSFKKLVTIWEEETGCHGDSIVKLQPETGCHGDSIVKLQPETGLDEEFTAPEINEVSFVINDLLEPSTRSEALKKYLYIGEHLHQRASQLDNKIDCFEKNILRTYFHVKPLDDDQLENWHHYLDYVEMNGDFDWAVKLYERCLIPCASYSEFWMRYVEYVESKGGREIANDALERATRIFLKDLPAIHLFNAGFKEQIGDICGARTAFLHFDMHSESSFIDYVMRRANMEKRLGNNVAASNVYKEALAVANKEMQTTLPVLYIQFSRLQYMVTNSVDASRDILIDGVRNVANCKQLLEELINLALNHEAARQISILDPIVADVIVPGSDVSRGLSYKDKLDISELYLKFIDLCGSIHDSRRAWERHVKLFTRSSRADSTCTQPVKASSRRKIHSDGTASVNPIEVTRTDEMNPSIQLSADIAENLKDVSDEVNAENLKHVPDEDGTCKADEESCKLVCEVADIDLMENDRNDNIGNIQKEQLDVSGRDEPPSLDILSLNEPVKEPRDLGSAIDHGCESNKEASPSNSMLECEQNTEPQPHPLSSNADVNSSGQGYCESPTDVQLSKDQKDPDSHPKRQSPMKYPEEQKHKESSLSSPRHGSEGKHHEGGSLLSLSREEQSQSPRQRFSPDERGVQSYSDTHRQDRPVYYDNSRGQRGRRMRNERRGPGAYARRARNVQSQRFTSTSQIHPPAQPAGYLSGHMGQYPTQHANVQSNEAYNQMWQYYYYQQQQQLMLLQQQSYPILQQQQVQPQPQQQLQSQANQMQLLQLQYQQMQQQLQYQVVESQGQQPQLYGDLQTQQQMQVQFQQQPEQSHESAQLHQHQMQSYQYQQQYFLYLQQLQQQPGGGPLHAQQVISGGKEEQNELQEQQLPETPHERQDGDQENGAASSGMNS